MPCHADEADQSLFPRLNDCFERASRPKGSRPVRLLMQGMELDQIHLIDVQQVKRAATIAAVLLLAAVVGVFFYLKRAPVSQEPVTRAKSTLVRLTNNNAIDAGPAYSPDGRRRLSAAQRGRQVVLPRLHR